MSDRVDRLERARRRLGLRQADVAAALGATQGHYSKVARRLVPAGPVLADAVDRWLATNDAADVHDPTSQASDRIASLAASIRDQCAELLVLAGVVRDRGRDASGPDSPDDRD